MSKLTKDSIFVAAAPPVPATPGSPPHPAYCTKVPTTTDVYTYIPVQKWVIVDESGFTIIITEMVAVKTGTTTTYVDQCYPASEGTPGTPGSAGSPAHTDLQIGWNSGAISIPSLPGNAQYTFSVRPDAVGVITGFNDSNEGVGYFEIDHGMYLRSGKGTIIESGKEIAGTDFGYGQSDILAVVRIGTQVRYYKGTTLLYTSLVPSYGSVYADCAMYMGGDQILDAALVATLDGPKYGAASGSASGTIRLFAMAMDNIVANQGQGRNLGPIRITSSAQQAITGQGDAYIKVGSTANALKPGVAVGLGYIGRITTYAESGLLTPDFAVIDQPFAPISAWGVGTSGDVGKQQNSYIKVTGSAWDRLAGGASVGIKVGSLAYTNDAVLGGEITGDIRLKPLTARADIDALQGGIISGAAVQLQRLTAKGYTGAQGKGTLQPLKVAWVLTQWNTIKGDVVLGELDGASYLLRGGKISGKVKLLQLLGASGGTEGPGHISGGGTSRDGLLTGALQALTAQGHITARETINAALLLNQLGASSSLSLYGFPITGNVILAPLYSSSGSRGLATLSGLVARGVLLDPTSVFEGWATNLRTGGTTRLANLPFLQMLQVPGGPLLGISNDGNVYELTGDKDIGQPIVWEFETGLSDMGESDMKRVPYVYIDGIVQGSIDITVLTDDPAKTYVYEYVAVARAQHKPHKRKLGNAIYTRSVGFRLNSVTGTYVEIDRIEPEIAVTPRRV